MAWVTRCTETHFWRGGSRGENPHRAGGRGQNFLLSHLAAKNPVVPAQTEVERRVAKNLSARPDRESHRGTEGMWGVPTKNLARWRVA